MAEHVNSDSGSKYERLYFDYSNFMERSAPGNLKERTYDPLWLQIIRSILHPELYLDAVISHGLFS